MDVLMLGGWGGVGVVSYNMEPCGSNKGPTGHFIKRYALICWCASGTMNSFVCFVYHFNQKMR